MCELESGLMCKTRDVITHTPVRWVRTRAIVFELGSWCWDPGLNWWIGPLVIGARPHVTSSARRRPLTAREYHYESELATTPSGGRLSRSERSPRVVCVGHNLRATLRPSRSVWQSIILSIEPINQP